MRVRPGIVKEVFLIRGRVIVVVVVDEMLFIGGMRCLPVLLWPCWLALLPSLIFHVAPTF